MESLSEAQREVLEDYAHEPEIAPGEVFYFEAFGDLSTCRMIGMTAGPIPWRDIVHYADRAGLDAEEAEAFTTIIRTMDRAWLDHQAEKGKRSDDE